MRRAEVIQTLNRNRDELARDYGIKTLALFGSVARGEATDSSDVDLLVEFDDRPVGLFHLVGAEQHLAELLHVDKVDLVLRRSVIPELKAVILEEAVDVFQAEGEDVAPQAEIRSLRGKLRWEGDLDRMRENRFDSCLRRHFS